MTHIEIDGAPPSPAKLWESAAARRSRPTQAPSPFSNAQCPAAAITGGEA